MIEMNLWNRNRLTDMKKQAYGYQRGDGVGEGKVRSLGLADTNYYI